MVGHGPLQGFWVYLAWKLAPLPDMLTLKLVMRISGPNPNSSIRAAGSRPRIARCTTATALRERLRWNNLPNAFRPSEGMPSQKE
jgi:hypothetical protein